MIEIKDIRFYELSTGRFRKRKLRLVKRKQRNVTVSDEQLEYIKSNHGKMSIGTISKMLGLTPAVTHNNMRVIGLVKPKPETAKIINFDKNGYFDIEEWGKLYQY